MLGILPFLIQWLAISHIGNELSHHSYPPKSHWTLLSELQQVPEDEIEEFLPQICNILIERDTVTDHDVFNYFERILLEKCAGCLPFGMRASSMLKVTMTTTIYLILTRK